MNKNNLTTFFLTSITFGLLSPMSFAASCPASSTNVSNISSCTVEGSGSDIKLNFISGFVSSTATSPVGGNNGKTIGEQRRLAFIKAAEIISYQVVSPQVIEVDARFSDLECNANSAVLGSAGATGSIGYSTQDSIPEGAVADVFYPIALANALADINYSYDFNTNSNYADIQANFNSNLGDSNCLFGGGWYYGFDDEIDSQTPFLSVLLHELTHGLGFSSLVDPQTFSKAGGIDDIFSNFLYVNSLSDTWNNLSDSQRLNSAISVNDLYWNGTNANTMAATKLNTGFSNGRIQMYAPANLEQGSSVSHFDISVSPSELMEPNLAVNACDTGIALGVLQDIGWPVVAPTENDFYLNIHCNKVNDGETFSNVFAGDTIKITPNSDTNSYSYTLDYDGSEPNANDLIVETSNGLFINTPTSGEFAGNYTLTVSNGSDPDITITIKRPLRVLWSSEAIMNNQSYSLKVEGGAGNTVYNLSQDPVDVLQYFYSTNNAVRSITAMENGALFNPASVNVKSNSVNAITQVITTVSDQGNAYDPVESVIDVYPSSLHTFTVIDSSNQPIDNAVVVITNSTLLQTLSAPNSQLTNNDGQASLYLPDTVESFSVLVNASMYSTKTFNISPSETSHTVTLTTTSTIGSNQNNEEKPKFGSGGGGTLPAWLLLLMCTLLLKRQHYLRD